MRAKTKYTDPRLWAKIKAEITAGSRGGKAGQWSARKAQLAVLLYEQAGGKYVGPKDPDNSLAQWTKQDWTTRSGQSSLKTGERYLPKAAIQALSPAEYAATTQAKRQGMARGQQFVPQPKKIAAKVAPYRKNSGRTEQGAEPKGSYLYHATHLGKMNEITARGLRPSGGSQFGGGYAAHSQGKVFLTNFDGLSYWVHKMGGIAEHNSDFHEEDDVSEWTPVALRVLVNAAAPYFVDELGNRDNRLGEAYYVKTPIPPDYIEIWDGSEWVEIVDADLSGLADDAISAAEFERDDDGDDGDDENEHQGYFLPNFDLFLPSEP